MKNSYEIRGKETVIFINYKGNILETIIDTEDLEKVMGMKNTWAAKYDQNTRDYYVSGWDKENIMLHRLIMNTPKWLVVDHIHHKTLDNRKNELRNVTTQENSQNMNKPLRWGLQQRNYVDGVFDGSIVLDK